MVILQMKLMNAKRHFIVREAGMVVIFHMTLESVCVIKPIEFKIHLIHQIGLLILSKHYHFQIVSLRLILMRTLGAVKDVARVNIARFVELIKWYICSLIAKNISKVNVQKARHFIHMLKIKSMDELKGFGTFNLLGNHLENALKKCITKWCKFTRYGRVL